MDKGLVRRLAAEMGVSPQTLNPLRTMPFELAAKALQEMKDAAKAKFKQLALKYHPDHNPDDHEGLMFKALVAAREAIEGLRVNPRRLRIPAQPLRAVRWTYYPAQTSTTTVTFRTRTAGSQTINSPTTAGVRSRPTYDARRVVFIRVS